MLKRIAISFTLVQKRISVFRDWIGRWQFDWHVGLYFSPVNDSEVERIIDDSQVNDVDVEGTTTSSNQVEQRTRENAIQKESPNRISPENKDSKRKRVKSLDAFRGLSITIMIFVNYGGGGYW